MIVIHRSVAVPYTPQQMFELVNNIEDYPRFLPWCARSRIEAQSVEWIEATLDIAWSGIHKSFTTRNYTHPCEKIEICLVSGPFKHLKGKWRFVPLYDKPLGCSVSLDLEFELLGSFVDRVFQGLFDSMANSLVNLFCKRAVEVYGTR